MEEGEQLTGGIEYATELFLPATAERMARHLEVGCTCHWLLRLNEGEPSAMFFLFFSDHHQHALLGHDKQQAVRFRRCCWQISQPHQAVRWMS